MTLRQRVEILLTQRNRGFFRQPAESVAKQMPLDTAAVIHRAQVSDDRGSQPKSSVGSTARWAPSNPSGSACSPSALPAPEDETGVHPAEAEAVG